MTPSLGPLQWEGATPSRTQPQHGYTPCAGAQAPPLLGPRSRKPFPQIKIYHYTPESLLLCGVLQLPAMSLSSKYGPQQVVAVGGRRRPGLPASGSYDDDDDIDDDFNWDSLIAGDASSELTVCAAV